MKYALFILILVLAAATAQAAELSFENSETGTPIADKIISISINEQEFIKQTDSSGKININIMLGQKAEFTIDAVETPGKDYYGTVLYDNETEIMLFPIASLRGIVKDSLDNIVSYADLKFACKPLPKINHPSTADRFGTFSTITPTGKCKIYASYEDALGFEEITIEQGELRDVEIKLDKTIVTFPAEKYTGWIVGMIAGLAIFAFTIYLVLRKKVPRQKAERKETTKTKDVMPTLNAKEKEIVQYLEINKGKALQSQIRHHTGIPRTSLARILKTLEDKNILQIRKEGKTVKIKLTDWFLGKE